MIFCLPKVISEVLVQDQTESYIMGDADKVVNISSIQGM